MARIDDYGLRGCIGHGSIDREMQAVRFERTQKAMADWRAEGGKGALGDFYAWLGVTASDPDPSAKQD